MGAGGTIKKQKRAPLELKLPKPPELGKLETHATFPLLDRITALSLGKQNDQLTNACRVTVRLVETKGQLTNACCTTMRLVEMKDQLTNACHDTMRLVELKDQLTNTCCATMRLFEMNNQVTNACCTKWGWLKLMSDMIYPTSSRQL